MQCKPAPLPANDNNQRPAAFDQQVLQWLPLMRKLAARLERNRQERGDLVQETIAIALHRWASFSPDGKLSGWLCFQMRERCRWLRRKRGSALSLDTRNRVSMDAESLLDFEVDYNASLAAPATQEHSVELAQVVDAIPARYRSVMARLAAGYEQQEIADEEGVSRQAIHQRVSACRRRLMKVTA